MRVQGQFEDAAPERALVPMSFSLDISTIGIRKCDRCQNERHRKTLFVKRIPKEERLLRVRLALEAR